MDKQMIEPFFVEITGRSFLGVFVGCIVKSARKELASQAPQTDSPSSQNALLKMSHCTSYFSPTYLTRCCRQVVTTEYYVESRPEFGGVLCSLFLLYIEWFYMFGFPRFTNIGLIQHWLLAGTVESILQYARCRLLCVEF